MNLSDHDKYDGSNTKSRLKSCFGRINIIGCNSILDSVTVPTKRNKGSKENYCNSSTETSQRLSKHPSSSCPRRSKSNQNKKIRINKQNQQESQESSNSKGKKKNKGGKRDSSKDITTQQSLLSFYDTQPSFMQSISETLTDDVRSEQILFDETYTPIQEEEEEEEREKHKSRLPKTGREMGSRRLSNRLQFKSLVPLDVMESPYIATSKLVGFGGRIPSEPITPHFLTQKKDRKKERKRARGVYKRFLKGHGDQGSANILFAINNMVENLLERGTQEAINLPTSYMFSGEKVPYAIPIYISRLIRYMNKSVNEKENIYSYGIKHFLLGFLLVKHLIDKIDLLYMETHNVHQLMATSCFVAMQTSDDGKFCRMSYPMWSKIARLEKERIKSLKKTMNDEISDLDWEYLKVKLDILFDELYIFPIDFLNSDDSEEDNNNEETQHSEARVVREERNAAGQLVVT